MSTIEATEHALKVLVELTSDVYSEQIRLSAAQSIVNRPQFLSEESEA